MAAALLPAELPVPDGASECDRAAAQLYCDHPDVNAAGDWVGWGTLPPGGDEQTRPGAYRWITAALERCAAGDRSYEPALRRVLSNCRLHTDHLLPGEAQFAALRSTAMQRIEAVVQRLEREVAEPQRLREVLGGVGGAAEDMPKPRQDDPGVLPALPPPETFTELMAEVERSCPNDAPYLKSDEYIYDYVLLLFAHALEQSFRDVCQRIGGSWRPGAVKSRQRIGEKRRGDYLASPSPKVAESADLNRACLAFADAEELQKGFAAAHALLGPPVRVKNGYSAELGTLGAAPRSLLCNYCYAPGLTWGELFDTPAAAESREVLWEASTRGMSEGLREGAFRRYFDAAAEFADSAAVRASPATLIVELQLMLHPYVQMRKTTHLWYRVARSANARELCVDFRS
eukprot:TRINITY_DN12461_c0_g1_i2.p1 TRINITY_DN12461_c0_g1~~TRINITY_DN12461_c0_g1_i2.p1  ORF type:complete len:441 (+),score=131.62 TRINITY_DN12461_c0_g1_i2:119-1324(+)